MKEAAEPNSALELLLTVEGPGVRPGETLKAWLRLTSECVEGELYDHLAEVVLRVVEYKEGRKSIFGVTESLWRQIRRRLDNAARDLDRIAESPVGQWAWPNARVDAEGLRSKTARMTVQLSAIGEVSPIDFAEWRVITFVKRRTGRLSFREIAALLDAACLCGLGEEGKRLHGPMYNPEALKKRYRRFRKRFGKFLDPGATDPERSMRERDK